MTGSVIYRPPEDKHRCSPPISSGYVPSPLYPVGTIWRCDVCGLVWTVARPPLVYRGQQRVLNEWRLARFRERRRARRAASAAERGEQP